MLRPNNPNKSFKTFKQEGEMKPSNQDEVKGEVHEVKGKIKEKVGKATNNPNLENEGANDEDGRKGPEEDRPS